MPKNEPKKTPLQQYRDKLAADPSRVGILTEGDSWFDLPFPGRPNIVEVLIKRFQGKAAFLRLEESGEEVRIMQAGQKWERLYQNLSAPKNRFDLILFSGGGNDIVGRALLPLLKQRESWMIWRDCINMARFERRLAQIEGAYHELVALRDDYHPAAWIFTHGYDLPIPMDKPIRVGPFKIGPWMKPYMDQKGITAAEDQRQIIHFMLERFGQMLEKIEDMSERFYYVRTQGNLKPDDWLDEIHPTKTGFETMATLIQRAICEEFPNLPKPD